jgi:hypothetical protein
VSDPNLRKGDAGDVNMLTERMDTVIARGLNLGLGASDLAGLFEGRLAKFVKKSEGRRDQTNE